MLIQKGRTYKDRSGRLVLILSRGIGDFPVEGLYVGGEIQKAEHYTGAFSEPFAPGYKGSWTVLGSWANTGKEHAADLIEEIVIVKIQEPSTEKVPELTMPERRLQMLVYLMVRDHISFGKLERFLMEVEDTVEAHEGKVKFSEPTQAIYALSIAKRLLEDKKNADTK